MKFEAKIHGAEFKTSVFSSDSSSLSYLSPQKTKSDLLFKDPEDYKKLTKKEKRSLTIKMMNRYKQVTNRLPLGA